MTKTATVMSLDKVMRIGDSVFVHAQYQDGRLSITGVIRPRRNSDADTCGQIDMSDWEIQAYAPGWSTELEGELRTVWSRWHLNHMRAGSKVQEDWLRVNPVTAVYPESHYDKASKALAEAGLNPDSDGYKYGHAWKYEEVPIEIIEFLASLPDADKQLAWI